MEAAISADYKKLIGKDASENSVHVLDSLANAERDDVNLSFGPTYLTTTSAGSEVRIKSFIIDYQQSENSLYRTLCLVAEDMNNRVLGSRQTFLRKQDNIVEATGKIVTIERGSGVGTLIELAHMDMLTREASEQKTPVWYEVNDQNTHELHKLHRQEANKWFFQRRNTPLLTVKEEEHKRWLSLYGPNGKLGFDIDAQRAFVPGEVSVPLLDIDTIVLQRSESVQNGRTLLEGVVSSITRTADRVRSQSKKRMEFLNITKPRLAAIAGKN